MIWMGSIAFRMLIAVVQSIAVRAQLSFISLLIPKNIAIPIALHSSRAIALLCHQALGQLSRHSDGLRATGWMARDKKMISVISLRISCVTFPRCCQVVAAYLPLNYSRIDFVLSVKFANDFQMVFRILCFPVPAFPALVLLQVSR
jgi:hypothetical protein